MDSSKIIQVTSDASELKDYASHMFKDGEKIIFQIAA
jgi:hypothetical protein